MTEKIKEFDSAARCTGARIRNILLKLPDRIKAEACEIHLRCGRPVMISGLFGEIFISESGRESFILNQGLVKASVSDVEDCFRILCGYSVHTHQNSICNGFVTVRGGHRAGIVGTAVTNKGETCAIRDVSSINIRISREFIGISDELFKVIRDNSYKSIIIAGAPSSGKTTVLRDLARNMAGEPGGYMKTVIIDEREEIAACCDGVPQNDIGISSDVLSGYFKGEAVMIALRSMAPQNIILDEIGTDTEAEAIEAGMNSGVNFYLSVHAANVTELTRRRQIIRLLSSGAFDAVAFLAGRENPSKIDEIITAGEVLDKIGRCTDGGGCNNAGGILCRAVS